VRFLFILLSSLRKRKSQSTNVSRRPFGLENPRGKGVASPSPQNRGQEENIVLGRGRKKKEDREKERIG